MLKKLSLSLIFLLTFSLVLIASDTIIVDGMECQRCEEHQVLHIKKYCTGGVPDIPQTRGDMTVIDIVTTNDGSRIAYIYERIDGKYFAKFGIRADDLGKQPDTGCYLYRWFFAHINSPMEVYEAVQRMNYKAGS